jgi:hypothetical protein
VPKNVYVSDENGRRIGLGNLNGGGFSLKDPLFLRGDRVTIEVGYKYRNQKGNEVQETNTIFRGFISNVGAKNPLNWSARIICGCSNKPLLPTKYFRI